MERRPINIKVDAWSVNIFQNMRMQYFDKSAVAQHALENNHHIGFDEARLIDIATNYWDRIRREAIEIKLQPNNFNRDSGLHISKS